MTFSEAVFLGALKVNIKRIIPSLQTEKVHFFSFKGCLFSFHSLNRKSLYANISVPDEEMSELDQPTLFVQTQNVWHYENRPIQNILKISPLKIESFQIKILIFFKFLLKT